MVSAGASGGLRVSRGWCIMYAHLRVWRRLRLGIVIDGFAA